MQNTSMLQTVATKLRDERGNCFLYGCVTLVILCILGGLIAFILFRNFAREVREKYTEASAATLPTAELPADQLEALIARVDEFARGLRAGEPVPTLTLTETEANALLQNHPDLKDEFGSIVYLTFDEGSVTGQMSVSLDWIPGFSSRYFNGTATFDVDVSRGRAELYLTRATVKGEAVPERYVSALRSENLASDWQRKNPDARTLLDKIESVTVEKGKVTITPVNKTEPAPAAGESVSEPEATTAN